MVRKHHESTNVGRIVGAIRTDIVRNKLLFIEEDSAMGKLGKKNKDSKEAANKKIAQQLAALKRKQAAKKK